MWKPPQRIRHDLLDADWPTKEVAERSTLFSPIEISSIQLAERTWVPAMVPWRATEEGEVTDDLLAWYRRLAQGQPGAIVVEATGIRDIPSGPLLRIGHDRFIPGLQELVEVVRTASEGRTHLLIQLIDFLAIRRRPEPEKYFLRYLQVTEQHRLVTGESEDDAVREALLKGSDELVELALTPRELEGLRYGARERVTDTDLQHIAALPVVLPGLFASAAGRAQSAGFDGIELHFAHAYTMASFLSPLNTRQDGYGGARANRVRLPLEVLAAVRDRVGDEYPVGCRYLAKECVEGGGDVDDAAFFGVEFAKAGMDFLSLSRGGKFEDAQQPKVGWSAYPYTGQSGYECMPTVVSDEVGPFGRNLTAVARIRAAVRAAGYQTPIVAAGGIATFDQAERILRQGEADIIASARQSLADPDWFRKLRLGRGSEMRRCVFTNYCEGLDQKHKQVTCQLWDRTGLEDPDVRLSSDGKRRLTPPEWKPGEGDSEGLD